MRTVKLWLWTALLATTIGSSAYAQEWASPFRHLPENTLAVAHVRLDVLLKSDWGKAALEEILSKKDSKEAFLKIKGETGIDPHEVESLTFVMLEPALLDGHEPRPGMRHDRHLLPFGNRGPTSPYYSTPPTQAPPIVVPSRPILPTNPVPAPPGGPKGPFPPPPLPPAPPVSPPPVFPSSYQSGLASPHGEFVSLEMQGGPNDDAGPLVIVTMRKPINRKQFMSKHTDPERSRPAHGILFLNDNTFVVGPEHAVVQFAANTNDKESELGKLLAQDLGKPMIQGGYRLTPALKKALQADPQAFGPMSLLFPLMNVNHATFAVDFGKQADVKFRLQAANERQANLASQAAKTLLAATEAASERQVADLTRRSREVGDAQSEKQIKEEIVAIGSLRKMAAAAQVEHRHTEVSIAMQMEVRPQQVVMLLQGMFHHESRHALTH